MEWPPKFSLDGKQILNLLTGDRFYSAKDAALREASLNAIDACGRRRNVETDIEPQIEIVFDQQAQTITITDNGDGMSRENLVSLFSKVGGVRIQAESSYDGGAVPFNRRIRDRRN